MGAITNSIPENRTGVRQLYLPAASQEFPEGSLPELRRLLLATAGTTMIAQVGHADDLVLDDHGHLRNDYQFTSTAFRQICHAISPGLRALLVDVSGMTPSPELGDSMYSLGEAAALFNRVLRLRFGGVVAGRLSAVYNTQRKTIDGFLGPSTAYLENDAFFDQCELFAGSQGLVFRYGWLSNRQLVVRFGETTPMANCQDRPLHKGVHMANSAITGVAIRGAVCLLRDDAAAALGNVKSGQRARHSGNQVLERVKRVFRRTLASYESLADIASQVAVCTQTLVGMPDTEEGIAKRRRGLVERFRRRRVNKGVAEAILWRALRQRGGADFSTLTERTAITVAQAVTIGDLSQAVLDETWELPWGQRIFAEQLAFGLLLGHLQITGTRG